MTSLSQTVLPAIVAPLPLGNPNHKVDLDMLENLTGDSTDFEGEDYQSYMAESLEMAQAGTNEILPGGNLLLLPESEYWKEYLADFSEESMSPVQISTDGSIPDDSISEGNLEDNENIAESDCCEPFVYDPLKEDWIKNGTVHHDLEVQSNLGIEEMFSGNSIPSEIHLVTNFSESGMDWVDWDKLMADLLSNEKKLERRENRLRKKADNGAKTCRYRSTRAAAGISRKKIENYSWKVGSYRDFQQSLIVKPKVTSKPVDLVL